MSIPKSIAQIQPNGLMLSCETFSCLSKAKWRIGRPDGPNNVAHYLCDKCMRDILANIPEELMSAIEMPLPQVQPPEGFSLVPNGALETLDNIKDFILQNFEDEPSDPGEEISATVIRLLSKKLDVPEPEFLEAPNIEEQSSPPNEPEVTPEYPKHLGGGWYLLPNGQKVQGKEEALEAMKGAE